jgi:class 3 adenylate cyclase/tetratricopeptide (TPR) repeat protein
MRCSKCGAENRETASFCDKCGAKLSPKCPSCGAENRSDAKFCDSCGAALSGSASTKDAKPEQQPRTAIETDRLEGERRHLSVLFCDLVGSTELSHHLDPEESRAIVLPYQRAAAQVVEQFGGHVAKFLGDGVMALFGWPQAHEDDAERAVRAALAVLEAISALNREFQGPKLSARIGIHTGEAVVAAGGDAAPDVFGDASNLASRVQSAADANTVVVTGQTHQLVAGRFVVESLGNKDLKGIDEPVELYRVIRPSGARGHLAASAVRGLTPFVGREDELRTLMNRWELAREGEGQVVLISGEAGIGKSRLVQQFQERLAATRHSWIKCELSPYLQNTPFAPVADMIQQVLGWGGEDAVEAKLAQLEQNLERVGLKTAEALPLLAPLLNLPVSEKYPPLALSPEQQRKRLLATLTDWLLGMARMQPLVMVLEDLQWSDPSTLEFHQMNVEQGATVPLILLYTTRPEFRAPWPMLAHHTQITLGRLRDRDVRDMVHAVAAQTALPEQMVEAVTSRSSGVPLFAEELTRAVVESGGRGEVEDIPGTLHNSLTARLDRLGAGKEAAQIASVLGREFSYPLLHAIVPMPEGELQSALATLIDAELIYARGVPPDASYIFKHALIQEAAYDALLKSRRKKIHRRVAEALVEKFPEVVAAQPAIIARHWTEGGEWEQAIAAWQRAADRSREIRAFKEAQEDYERALRLLKTKPESPARDEKELALLSSLSEVLLVTRGLAGRDTVNALKRAKGLAEKTGNSTALRQLLQVEFSGCHASGHYAAAAVVADQMLDVALHETDPSELGFARLAQLATRLYLGDLAGAEEHFIAGSPIFASANFRESSSPAWAQSAYGHSGWLAWVMGRARTARDRVDCGIAAARERKSPYELAWAQYMASYLELWLGDATAGEAAALEAQRASEECGSPLLRAWSRISLGSARAQLGQAVEAIGLIRQGMSGLVEVGSDVKLRDYHSLTEAQVLEGAVADALATIEAAITTKASERWMMPESFRLRGRVLLTQGRAQLAEVDFRKAIGLSRDMSAKMLELRATTSLARLLRENNRRDEARAMLADIYNWFTEGFDTADLKDAKALFEDLVH